MRRWLLLSALLLAGCQNTIGPLENRHRGRPDDPYFSVEEQKRFGRDRYSQPQDSFANGPNTGIATYGPTGR
jgi:hypothetical protein